MNSLVTFCVISTYLVAPTNEFLLFDSASNRCSGSRNVTHVTIPTGISLIEFDSIIAGNVMSELYYALPKPPKYTPDINYFATFRKLNATHYIRRSTAETPISPANCTEGSVYLHVLSGYKTAQFHIYSSFFEEGFKVMQVIWSTCPRKYFWSMRCVDFEEGRTKCLRNKVSFGLYITGSLDDLPMQGILNDLSKTGVLFGSEEFKWTFTYGKNMLCEREKQNE